MGNRVTPLMFNPESGFGVLFCFVLSTFFPYVLWQSVFQILREFFVVAIVLLDNSFDVFHTQHILLKVLIKKMLRVPSTLLFYLFKMKINNCTNVCLTMSFCNVLDNN